MVLYLVTIFICMTLISVFNIIFSTQVYDISWWLIIIFVVISTIAVIAVDAVVSIIVRKLPKKLYNPFRKRYKVFKWEKSFYEKTGIKFWKDKIPEMGKLLVGFRKDVVGDISNNEHIFEFMSETCYAEIMHLYSAFIGYIIMLFLPLKFCMIIGFPVACVNLVLQILPILVQRYTRPKLAKVYERNAKRLKVN